jgi:hypothetical protein
MSAHPALLLPSCRVKSQLSPKKKRRKVNFFLLNLQNIKKKLLALQPDTKQRLKI